MSEKLKTQREGYLTQLKGVESSLQESDRQRERLFAQREQLKGAIFALDTLAQSEEAATTAEATSSEAPEA